MFIPYSRQSIDDEDIKAVVDVLRSDWITTGPTVERFENAFSDFSQAQYAIAVSSGTAALHAAMFAIGIKQGDEVIVPPITFAATANAIMYQGGTPVFADVEKDTLLINPNCIQERITEKTKAIISVDYAGQSCDYDQLREIAEQNGLVLMADACHSLGGSYKHRPVGSLADLNVFSFHPVKNITTGEGGMITTDNPEYAEKMRIFRNHGITTDHKQRMEKGSWFYEMVDLGFNYRITDFQCALGISQLKKLPEWTKKRQAIADQYNRAFSEIPEVRPLEINSEISHAYHLYVVRIDFRKLGISRETVFKTLKKQNIGVNVHYIPVHLHPYYQNHLNTGKGLCPVAEKAYESLLSLPIFPELSMEEIKSIVDKIYKAIHR